MSHVPLTGPNAVQFVSRAAAEEIHLPADDGAPLFVCAGAPNLATQCRRVLPGNDLVVDFSLDAGREVSGSCHVGRRPAAGATVFLVPAGIESRGAIAVPLRHDSTSTTFSVPVDEKGQFSVAHVAPGEYILELHLRGGRVQQSGPVRIPALKKADESRHVAVPPIRIDDGLTIEIAVLTAEGHVVEAAGVGIVQRDGGPASAPATLEGHTGKTGRVTLEGLRGDRPATLTCVARGFARYMETYDTPPRMATCVLQRLAALHGTVASADGDPLGRATISLSGTGVQATSDAKGRFAVHDLDPGTYQVRITAPGYRVWSKELKIAAGEDLDMPSVQLLPGETLRGRVVDAETGGAVIGAAIAIVDPPGSGSSSTDDDGNFSIVSDVAASPLAHVSATEYADVELRLDRVDGNVARLSRPGALEVTAWDEKNDSPCAACKIAAFSGSSSVDGLTDAAGVVTFRSLRPAVYQVTREEVVSGASAVTVSGGSDSRIVTIRPRELARIRLGEPARPLRVRLTPPPDPQWSIAAVTPSRAVMATATSPGEYVLKRRRGERVEIRLVKDAQSIYAGVIAADMENDTVDMRLGSSALTFVLETAGVKATAVPVTLMAGNGQVIAFATASFGTPLSIPYLDPGSYVLSISGRIVNSAISVKPGTTTDLGPLSVD